MLESYLPTAVNTGPWLTAYTLPRLQALPTDTEFVLPICSLATPYRACEELGTHLLPPLYHEAMDASLKAQLIERVLTCFPEHGSLESNRQRVRIVEMPREALSPRPPVRLLAFSVDTAVEEHGPHLPLATDTIQSYGVLRQLLAEATFEGVELFRPVDYGQLTWGLPFGFSVDLTAELLTRYVSGFANAVVEWRKPDALYVVDVHGSITHRQAIVAGLDQVRDAKWAFRWLHEPLAEFASARGDQHAGGVETACVEYVDPALVDGQWWPTRLEEIAQGQMSFEKAVELTPDLSAFTKFVQERSSNGVIGDIRNYHQLDAALMFERMTDLARHDIEQLLEGNAVPSRDAGRSFW